MDLSLSLSPHFDPFTKERIPALLALLEQHAPMMEYLSICTEFQETPQDYRLLDGVASALPRLMHLQLNGYSMAWKNSAFRNLKSLELENLKPSASQLLDMLSQTHLLETFFVDEIKEPSGALPLRATTTHLTRLQSLKIGGDLLSCAFFFEHLLVALNTCVYINPIDIQDSRLDESTTISLLRLLSRKVGTGIGGSIVKLRLGGKSGLNNTQYWKSQDLQTFLAKDMSIITMGCRAFDSQYFERLRNVFLQSLRLDHLLCVDIDTNLPDETWSFLGGLPRVKHIQLTSNEKSFPNALQRGLMARPDSPPLLPAFVALESMEILCWDLHHYDRQAPRMCSAMRLADCLALRKAAGLPLTLLTLKNCRGVRSEDTMGHLKKFIERIDYGAGNGDNANCQCEACCSRRNSDS
ncbi:hypothetical protein C0991_012155 [Blastosporella zonata]|nr:hypothetical protein C0991_012155 [Blastosporella zonata]